MFYGRKDLYAMGGKMCHSDVKYHKKEWNWCHLKLKEDRVEVFGI